MFDLINFLTGGILNKPEVLESYKRTIEYLLTSPIVDFNSLYWVFFLTSAFYFIVLFILSYYFFNPQKNFVFSSLMAGFWTTIILGFSPFFFDLVFAVVFFLPGIFIDVLKYGLFGIFFAFFLISLGYFVITYLSKRIDRVNFNIFK